MKEKLQSAMEKLAQVQDEVRILEELFRHRKERVVGNVIAEGTHPLPTEKVRAFVDYYDPASRVISQMRKIMSRRTPSREVSLHEETYCMMEGIGRSGIVRLTNLPRPQIAIFGTLIETAGNKISIEEFANQTGFASSTITQGVCCLRNQLALSYVRFETERNNSVSLKANKKDQCALDDEGLALEVELHIRDALVKRGYEPVENNIAYTSSDLLRGVAYILQKKREEVTEIPFSEVPRATDVLNVKAKTIAWNIASIFPINSVFADNRTNTIVLKYD